MIYVSDNKLECAWKLFVQFVYDLNYDAVPFSFSRFPVFNQF